MSLSTTHVPARELGFLLHKHPDSLQRFELPFGRALAFYPVASDERCTFALAVEADPVAMVREREGGPDEYVNDRPYAASSFLVAAVSKVLGTARSGRCAARPDLAGTAIPLEATVEGVAGDAASVEAMFAPLGYAVGFAPLVVGTAAGPVRTNKGTLTLRAVARVADLLDHLCVLLVALDGDRHTYVSDGDIDRIVAASPWLATHPNRARIARGLGKGIRSLEARAVAAMDGGFTLPPSPPEDDGMALTLDAMRRNFVVAQVAKGGDGVVADLGCGEGKLLRRVRDMPAVHRWLAVDASARVVETLGRRLAEGSFDLPGRVRVEVLQGMLTAEDSRLHGVGTAVLSEVVEHVDPPRLPSLRDAVLGRLRPRRLVVTTPNREFNATWGLAEGALRHRDHRFEWTRGEFRSWVEEAGRLHGYGVALHGIGHADDDLGPPTQAAVLTREDA